MIFTLLSKGPTPITFPALTYTGNSMTLTCGDPEINVGEISQSTWKHYGSEIKDSVRIKITASGAESNLTVNNVILADIGK